MKYQVQVYIERRSSYTVEVEAADEDAAEEAAIDKALKGEVEEDQTDTTDVGVYQSEVIP